jgi:hypothetical protein
VPQSSFAAVSTGSPTALQASLDGVTVVVAAGGAGAMLLPSGARKEAQLLKVAVDLNAVPPLGVEGVETTDKAADRDGVICYGAIGVGGMKMKIHTRAIQRLFESNDAALDAEEIFALGRELFA